MMRCVCKPYACFCGLIVNCILSVRAAEQPDKDRCDGRSTTHSSSQSHRTSPAQPAPSCCALRAKSDGPILPSTEPPGNFPTAQFAYSVFRHLFVLPLIPSYQHALTLNLYSFKQASHFINSSLFLLELQWTLASRSVSSNLFTLQPNPLTRYWT